ncbi:hypothetical protein FA15DRAFT_664377 [Coprinopsis marcescibilis]|uniref:Uncharacterized protein n=1 Tax=Coprinopsis marcescibilis TaxID=230819 RepID=A0A5C3L8I2_COPMA|nr:hypothetical protein FA15DRAFT_664377 [Coprinopsis marcescibilis]
MPGPSNQKRAKKKTGAHAAGAGPVGSSKNAAAKKQEQTQEPEQAGSVAAGQRVEEAEDQEVMVQNEGVEEEGHRLSRSVPQFTGEHAPVGYHLQLATTTTTAMPQVIVESPSKYAPHPDDQEGYVPDQDSQGGLEPETRVRIIQSKPFRVRCSTHKGGKNKSKGRRKSRHRPSRPLPVPPSSTSTLAPTEVGQHLHVARAPSRPISRGRARYRRGQEPYVHTHPHQQAYQQPFTNLTNMACNNGDYSYTADSNASSSSNSKYGTASWTLLTPPALASLGPPPAFPPPLPPFSSCSSGTSTPRSNVSASWLEAQGQGLVPPDTSSPLGQDPLPLPPFGESQPNSPSDVLPPAIQQIEYALSPSQHQPQRLELDLGDLTVLPGTTLSNEFHTDSKNLSSLNDPSIATANLLGNVPTKPPHPYDEFSLSDVYLPKPLQPIDTARVEAVLAQPPFIHDPGNGPRVRDVKEFLRSRFFKEEVAMDVPMCREFGQEEVLQMLCSVLDGECARILWYNKSRATSRICPTCQRLYRIGDVLPDHSLGDETVRYGFNGGESDHGGDERKAPPPPQLFREQEISGLCSPVCFILASFKFAGAIKGAWGRMEDEIDDNVWGLLNTDPLVPVRQPPLSSDSHGAKEGTIGRENGRAPAPLGGATTTTAQSLGLVVRMTRLHDLGLAQLCFGVMPEELGGN